MGFHRLLETAHGQIVLLNLRETIHEGLLDEEVAGEFLRKTGLKLQALPSAHVEDDLVAALGEVVWSDPRYMISARETPSSTLHIAAVRTLSDVLPALKRIRKVHAPPELASLFDPPTSTALHAAARLLNQYSTMMPHLTLGEGFNAFWATTREAIEEIEAGSTDPAHDVRDILGLVQHNPSKIGGPIPLFLFEGVAPLGALPNRDAFRCARPTTLDGFNNPRFRQARPHGFAENGCGATVDIRGGAYSVGVPEIISTEMPLRGQLKCRYLGKVLRDPAGNDTDFIRFLAGGRTLQDVAAELDALFASAA